MPAVEIRGVIFPPKYVDHVQEWVDRVFEKADDVDPNRTQVWRDLCVGFFLGRGLTPPEAHDLARMVRAAKLL